VFLAQRRIDDVECPVALLEAVDEERQQELIAGVDVVGQDDDVALDLSIGQPSWRWPLSHWRETASLRTGDPRCPEQATLSLRFHRTGLSLLDWSVSTGP
jgi:hypothetical protein